jgi:hypothetical protein
LRYPSGGDNSTDDIIEAGPLRRLGVRETPMDRRITDTHVAPVLERSKGRIAVLRATARR